MVYSRILVMQTAFLGDVFLCVPLLKALRTRFPDASLAFLTRPGVKNFFLSMGIVDHCFEVKKSDKADRKHIFEETRRFNPDLIVAPHRSLRTALWAWRLRPSMSIGFRDPWTFFAYKKRIRRPVELHDAFRQLALIQGVGVDFHRLPSDVVKPRFTVTSHPRFEIYRGAVALAPGSQWATKRWTKEGFVHTAKAMEAQGRRIIIVGTKEEHSLGEEISSHLNDAVNFCGHTNIGELAQLLSVCRVLICNDSGAMHVAASVGTPVVAIFGPTVPSQGYAPWSDRAKILEENMPCRPCGAHGHDQCPIGTHDCMKKVTAQKVFDAAQEFLI